MLCISIAMFRSFDELPYERLQRRKTVHITTHICTPLGHVRLQGEWLLDPQSYVEMPDISTTRGHIHRLAYLAHSSLMEPT